MRTVAIFLLACLSFPFKTALSEDWPTSRSDAQSTGFALGSLPADPQLLWQFAPEKSGFEGSAVIADGKLWIGDVEGKMFCLELATGTQLWCTAHKNGFVVSPAYRNGRVVAGDFDGHVYCYSANDGTVLWEADLNQAIAGGANFIDELALLTSEAGQLFALDLATGNQSWEYATGDQLRSSPTLWNDSALLGGCDGRLHQINARTGASAGEGLLLDGPSGSTPAVIENIAVVPTQSGQVLAFDLKNVEKLWSFSDAERAQEIRSSPAVVALDPISGSSLRLAIITTRNRRVLALNLANGEMAWEAVVRKRCDASPVVCDGRVWVGGLDGTLYAFDLRTGEQTWSYQLSGQLIASPSIADGKLIVATDKGVVACFGSVQKP